MISVLHVTTNVQFLSSIDRFKGPGYRNASLVIRGHTRDSLTINGTTSPVLPYAPHSVREVVHAADDFDMVVLHDLDAIKSVIANELPERIAIGWRFFGYELYGRHPAAYCSESTMRAMKPGAIGSLVRAFGSPLSRAAYVLKWRRLSMEADFHAAVKRVNYFFGLVPEEYEHLTTRWGPLPTYVRFPLSPSIIGDVPRVDRKEDLVLVGNSRSVFNNHLDVLQCIESHGGSRGNRFLLPFGYGAAAAYASSVRRRAEQLDGVEILSSFLANDEYRRLFSNVQAAVYNGYRQMALWNIGVCLVEGVKLYLNERNATYAWLRRLGFHVNSMEHFGRDLERGALRLDQDEAVQNYELYRNLVEEYGYGDFQAAMSSELSRRVALQQG